MDAGTATPTLSAAHVTSPSTEDRPVSGAHGTRGAHVGDGSPPWAVYSTGSPPLDLVLGGGIPAASTVVVAGLPGTGKTILAEQFLFANVTEDAPALYLTTLSEPLEKVVRYLQRFTFFREELLPGCIHYQDIGQDIREHGIERLPALLETLLLERGASFVVIDSFKALHDLGPDPAAFRSVLFDVGRVLTASGVTALLVGEYGAREIASFPEFAIADYVIELANRAHGVRDERVLRVHKLRGAAHLPGEHSFRIQQSGLRVFPRLTGAGSQTEDAPAARLTSGIAGLDELLGGGLWEGSTTLVTGPTGVGKTTLGLHYLLAGAARGESGVLVAFQETPAQMRRLIAEAGATAEAALREGLLHVLYISPLELDLVEVMEHVQRLVERGGARRLVLDALGDMAEAALTRDRFRAAVWTLQRFLASTGTTGLLLAESHLARANAVDAAGAGGPGTEAAVTGGDISYMVDNVVLLQYLRPAQDGRDRYLEVLKTRGSAHDSARHPYSITAAAIDLAPAGVPTDLRL